MRLRSFLLMVKTVFCALKTINRSNGPKSILHLLRLEAKLAYADITEDRQNLDNAHIINAFEKIKTELKELIHEITIELISAHNVIIDSANITHAYIFSNIPKISYDMFYEKVIELIVKNHKLSESINPDLDKNVFRPIYRNFDTNNEMLIFTTLILYHTNFFKTSNKSHENRKPLFTPRNLLQITGQFNYLFLNVLSSVDYIRLPETLDNFTEENTENIIRYWKKVISIYKSRNSDFKMNLIDAFTIFNLINNRKDLDTESLVLIYEQIYRDFIGEIR